MKAFFFRGGGHDPRCTPRRPWDVPSRVRM